MERLNHRHFALPGILLIGSLLIAACGDDGPSTTPSAVSKPTVPQETQVSTEPTAVPGSNAAEVIASQDRQQPPETSPTFDSTASSTSTIAVPEVTEASPTPSPTQALDPTLAAAAPAQPSSISSSIHNFRLEDLNILVGTTVTWVHNDPVGFRHTSTSGIPDDVTDLWESGDLINGATFQATFDEVGTFSYFCRIHPTAMRATITVVGFGTEDSTPGTPPTLSPIEDPYLDPYEY